MSVGFLPSTPATGILCFQRTTRTVALPPLVVYRTTWVLLPVLEVLSGTRLPVALTWMRLLPTLSLRVSQPAVTVEQALQVAFHQQTLGSQVLAPTHSRTLSASTPKSAI